MRDALSEVRKNRKMTLFTGVSTFKGGLKIGSITFSNLLQFSEAKSNDLILQSQTLNLGFDF